MIIVMQKQASAAHIDAVVAFIHSRGLSEHISRGEERTIIGAVGDERVFEPREIEALAGVEKAMRVLHDWRIISRETQSGNSIIYVRGVAFGADQQTIPVYDGGTIPAANALFADPFFQPGTPYTSRAHSHENDRIRHMKTLLAQAHAAAKPVLLRIRDVRQIEPALAAEADVLYLGGELMTNRLLQDEVGRLNVPVVLCKDKHHLVDDWLIAAEHIALKGNHHIMLGEAGTLNLDHHAPYRLDTDAIAKARQLSHLPVLANIVRLPHTYMSTATLYRLALAAGANGIIVPEGFQAA